MTSTYCRKQKRMEFFRGYICIIYPLFFLLYCFQLLRSPPSKSTFGVHVYNSQTNLRNILAEEPVPHKPAISNQNSSNIQTTTPLHEKEHFLTLFTTFNSSRENFYVYNNTLRNWMLMKPKVVLVLFSDDPELKATVKSLGWDLTLDVGLKACNGTPVLKDMFLTAHSHVNSKFYAYANADILFDRGLMRTLEALDLNKGISKKPFLLSGKRSDLVLDKNKISNIVGDKEADDALMKSSVSWGYANDYFVVNKAFPWKIYPNLVIGRPMVDNYLLFVTRKSKIYTIDGSATVGAIHQKTKKRKKIYSNCNKDILGKLWSRRKMARGNVECLPIESRFKFDGNVTFMRRGYFTTAC